MNKQSFTLIELLVVIAILAILAVAVVLVINPIDLMRQSRDSTRLTDLNSINKALALFDVTNPDDFTGTSTVVYVSLPVLSEGTCPGLPTLPSGYTYKCVTSSTLTKIDGTGWIPANLQSISYGSPIGKLPLDPVNSSTTGQYYTYIMGGSWALSARIESEKYYYPKAFNDNGYDPDRMEIGSNLSLYQPVTNLVGHYFAQPGSGTTALDYSGNGRNGTITAGTGGWTTDQNDESNLAYDFDGTTTTIDTGSDWLGTATATINAWIKADSSGEGASGPGTGGGRLIDNGPFLYYFCGANKLCINNNVSTVQQPTNSITYSQWYHVAVTRTSAGIINFYVNGVLSGDMNQSVGAIVAGTTNVIIGNNSAGSRTFDGQIADMRIYNRVLTAAEILAIYNSTR